MKKLTVLLKNLSFTSVIVTTLFASRCTAQMSESELDPSFGINGGFEHSKNGLPVNWLTYTNKTVKDADFDLVFDKSVIKEGKQSLKYVVRKCSGKSGRFSPGIAQEIPVKTGEEYEISFWTKNEGTEYLFNIISVDAFNSSSGPKLQSADNSSEWIRHTYQYKIPAKMKNLRIELNIMKPGTFWIDGLAVKKIHKDK